MISSTLFKCSIAIILLAHVQVSAFLSPSTSATMRNAFPSSSSAAAATNQPPFQTPRDVRCNATNKRENCPGKTAFDNKNTIGGVGGLNMNIMYKTNKKAKVSTTPKPKPKKSVTKSSSIKTTKGTKKNVGGVDSDPTKTPWSSIILAFLTPWRNPNSIFLYLFLIVNILGSMNATPK